MQSVVLPALDRFSPELIVVACGFDAGNQDPLARMMVTSEGFRHLARAMVAAAERHCAGRIGFDAEQPVPGHEAEAIARARHAAGL